VINHLTWFWSHRVALAQRVRELGWDVVVAAPGAGSDPALRSQSFRSAEIAGSSRDWGRTLTAFVHNVWQIKRLLKDERPTVLHAITLKAGLPAALAARWFDATTTVVITVAGLGYLSAGAVDLVAGPREPLCRCFADA